MNVVRQLISVKDEGDNAPIHIAALRGQEHVVKVLVNEFGCNAGEKGEYGRTPLHYACKNGHVNVVRQLIMEMQCEQSAKDEHGDAPIHIAALRGQEHVVKVLVNEFGCNAGEKGEYGRTPLHYACKGGHVNVVRQLILEMQCEQSVKDEGDNAPIHIAALHGQEHVVKVLVNEFGCNAGEKGGYGRTPLHCACENGHVNVVRQIILEIQCEQSVKDEGDNAPIHIAALCRQEHVIKVLVDEFGCNAGEKGEYGRTPLHYACKNGHVNVVRQLIMEMYCEQSAKDEHGDAPIHNAALRGQEHVVKVLVNEFGCNAGEKGEYGRTPLHYACKGGHVNVVRQLILKMQCEQSVKDERGDTPIHFAALHGQEHVIKVLVDEFGCNAGEKGEYGRTPLHYACKGGHVNVVRQLILEMQCEQSVKDEGDNAPIHIAALCGQEHVIKVLVDEFGCNAGEKGEYGRTPLHYACKGGHVNVVRQLLFKLQFNLSAKGDGVLSEFQPKVDIPDVEGNTILHLLVRNENVDVDLVINLLAVYKANPNPKNSSGHTPLYYATLNRNTRIVSELVKYNCNPAAYDEDYRTLEAISQEKLSGGSLTKVFVIGNKYAGKSTLIEALRNETQQDACFTEKVIPHTAGIIPSVHTSEQYGRVLFYDFAGDPEYYSSHAASLERLLTSSRHIFLLVEDFSEEEEAILQTLGYWLTFISYNSKDDQTKSQVVIVGSHADVTESKGENSEEKVCEVFTEISYKFGRYNPYIEMVGYCSLNCRESQSTGTEKLCNLLKNCCFSSGEDEPLSVGAVLLLGVLQRDFKGVIACEVSQICRHIELTEMYLPQGVVTVYSYLRELNAQGVILILGNREGLSKEWVILDVSTFLATVHKNLFSCRSLSSVCSTRSLSNLGLISESDLKNVLDKYDAKLLKQCLKYLQYCIELDDSEILQKIFSATVVETDASESCGILGPSKLSLENTVKRNSLQNTGESDLSSTSESEFSENSSESDSAASSESESSENTSESDSAASSDSELSEITSESDSATHTANSDSNLLFFPSLLKGIQQSGMKWFGKESYTTCKGWYIKCSWEYDYFPPRFLHVLLLRLAFNFALPACSTRKEKNVHLYSRRCTMWKNGIHWWMDTDVECVVEVVKQSKGVMVMVKSKREFDADCTFTFSKIVGKVLEAKQDFCPSLITKDYLIHPDDMSQDYIPSFKDLHLFDMNEVKKALTDNKRVVVSADECGERTLPLSRLPINRMWSKLLCMVLHLVCT